MDDDKFSENPELYKILFENNLDAVFIADAITGMFVNCNRSACKLLGKEKSEVVGQHQSTIHPPEDLKGKFSTTFKQHLQNKTGQILRTKVITKTGQLKDVDIKANIFRLNGRKFIQGIFRDITESKKAEDKLLIFQKVVDESTDAIGMSTPEGKHHYQNKAFDKMFGRNIEQIEGKSGPPSTVYVDENVGRDVFNSIMKCKPWAGEVEMYDKDHNILIINLRAYSIKDESGKCIGLVGVHTDISKKRKAEEELKKKNEELEIFNKLAIGRELKMVELKKKIKELGGKR